MIILEINGLSYKKEDLVRKKRQTFLSNQTRVQYNWFNQRVRVNMITSAKQ